MNALKTIIFVALYAATIWTASASDSLRRHLFADAGWLRNTTRDAAYSQNKYAAQGAVLLLGYSSSTALKIWRVDVQLQGGRLKATAPSALSSRISLVGMEVNVRRLQRVFNDLNFARIYLGGGLLTQSVYRQHASFSNNAYQYDHAHSLSVEGMLRREELLFKRPFKVHWSLSLPLISAVIRPSFNSSIPEGVFDQWDKPVRGTIKSFTPAVPFSFFRLKSETGIAFPLLNGNEIGLAYGWNFYHYGFERKLTSATHMITCSFKFNLCAP